MVARPPVVRFIECMNKKTRDKASRRKDKVELTARLGGCHASGVISWNICAFPGEFNGPRFGAATVRSLGSDERDTHSPHPLEHSRVPGAPIDAAIFAIPVEYIEVASSKHAVSVLLSDKHSQVRDETMDRSISVDPTASRRKVRPFP